MKLKPGMLTILSGVPFVIVDELSNILKNIQPHDKMNIIDDDIIDAYLLIDAVTNSMAMIVGNNHNLKNYTLEEIANKLGKDGHIGSISYLYMMSTYINAMIDITKRKEFNTISEVPIIYVDSASEKPFSKSCSDNIINIFKDLNINPEAVNRRTAKLSGIEFNIKSELNDKISDKIKDLIKDIGGITLS